MRSDCRMLWLGPAGPEPLHKFARVRFWPVAAITRATRPIPRSAQICPVGEPLAPCATSREDPRWNFSSPVKTHRGFRRPPVADFALEPDKYDKHSQQNDCARDGWKLDRVDHGPQGRSHGGAERLALSDVGGDRRRVRVVQTHELPSSRSRKKPTVPEVPQDSYFVRKRTAVGGSCDEAMSAATAPSTGDRRGRDHGGSCAAVVVCRVGIGGIARHADRAEQGGGGIGAK